MAVTLPAAVGPGGSVQIEIEWTGRIPFAAARTGWIADYYFFGQWFPKIGVLEDTAGTPISSMPPPSSTPISAPTTCR
jgi:hypothetical protein